MHQATDCAVDPPAVGEQPNAGGDPAQTDPPVDTNVVANIQESPAQPSVPFGAAVRKITARSNAKTLLEFLKEPLALRLAMSHQLRQVRPNNIPFVVDMQVNNTARKMQRLSVEKSLTLADLLSALHDRLREERQKNAGNGAAAANVESSGLFMFLLTYNVADDRLTSSLPKLDMLVSEAFAKHRNVDNFVYLTVKEETVFG